MNNEWTFIIAVALGVAFVLVILVLVAVIVYQRWRISDSNVHLEKFITENLKLKDGIDKLQDENDELNDKLDEVTGSVRSRHRPPQEPLKIL